MLIANNITAHCFSKLRVPENSQKTAMWIGHATASIV